MNLIYKYAGKEGVKAILSNETLKFEKLDSFNDPFEFHPALVDKVPSQKHIRSTVERRDGKISKERRKELKSYFVKKKDVIVKLIKDIFQSQYDSTRICCSSHSRNHILMRGHYTENHTGACLVFDKKLIEKDFLQQFSSYANNVRYTKKIQTVSINKKDKAIKHLSISKNSIGQYEKEYRIILGFNPNEYQKFSPQSLKQIIFGCKTDEIFKTIIINLIQQKGWQWVAFSEMSVSQTEYKLVEKPIKYVPSHTLINSKQRI
ncbi:MAG: DUF2971 domain-containing protein [Prevotellaceae bacterium]|jgi:hypothetical protein|nr:DUF2971 domain-containing protein [Prevotellaceae bacterium]